MGDEIQMSPCGDEFYKCGGAATAQALFRKRVPPEEVASEHRERL